MVLPPIARKGTTISIRKFFKDKLTVERLVSFGSMTAEMAHFINACVILKENIIVSGGTGSGKTTLLNVLSQFIPNEERILTIEDSAELQLNQEHLVPFEIAAPRQARQRARWTWATSCTARCAFAPTGSSSAKSAAASASTSCRP